jgi:hypothetical protein
LKNCNNFIGDGHSTNINISGKLENEYAGLNIRVLTHRILMYVILSGGSERVICNLIFEYEYNIFNIPICVNRRYGLDKVDHGATYIRKTTIQNTILSGGSERE